MRIATAVAASIALHAGLFAIPGREFEQSASRGDQPVAPMTAVLLPAQASRAAETVVLNTDVPDEPSPEPPDAGDEATADRSVAANEIREEQPAFAIPLPHYYEPGEVSDRAQPRDDIVLDSPAITRFPGAGQAILVLYINEAGRVDRIEVPSTDIETQAVQNSIAEQFRSAQFSPARIGGQPVKSKMKIEVVIKPPIIIPPAAALPQLPPAAESSSVPAPPPALPPPQPPRP